MFIQLQVEESYSKDVKPSTEICTFEGIRYDSSSGLAILSTEHNQHDYVLPMDEATYLRLTQGICSLIGQGVSLINLTGSPALRVKHGSRTNPDRTKQYSYKVTGSGAPVK